MIIGRSELQPMTLLGCPPRSKPVFSFRQRVVKVARAYIAVELRDALAKAGATARPRA